MVNIYVSVTVEQLPLYFSRLVNHHHYYYLNTNININILTWCEAHLNWNALVKYFKLVTSSLLLFFQQQKNLPISWVESNNKKTDKLELLLLFCLILVLIWFAFNFLICYAWAPPKLIFILVQVNNFIYLLYIYFKTLFRI